ncbi:hypothetical protein JNUCC1_02908 [Lentibacillus sp. JNUCC-1]|uniref:IDEAL domain-containing protein n=1 Tax=Lentibacillus sp. JNUCC-1 TaxID=2654513 RepID=UPI0012E83862|nr:IDEAL domain-containing protein [Lentibacillus sp. JNUCC-1]MUV39036.1 hypothetical protein [Lentibacillus sp. JNUCC-1]
MVKVKMLKPYYIKIHTKTLRIVLAYQYFSVFINEHTYQFIPIESSEIRVNLQTKKIENTDARFAFQKGKSIMYMTMTELSRLPDFLEQLHGICEPYYESDNNKCDASQKEEVLDLITELENLNRHRLIDKALDEGDYEAFQKLTQHF